MKRQTSPIRVEQLDPDYAKNLTHFSKIFNWLNEGKISLIKQMLSSSKNAFLGFANCFTIMSM
jgi:hypothetical protein